MTAKFALSAMFPEGEATEATSIDLTWEEDLPDLGVILALVRTVLGRQPDAVVVDPSGPAARLFDDPTVTTGTWGRTFQAGRLLRLGERVAADAYGHVWPTTEWPPSSPLTAVCQGVTLEQVGVGILMEFEPDGRGRGAWRAARANEVNGGRAA